MQTHLDQSVRKCGLHPLIHTLLKFAVAQYVESQSMLLRFGQRTPTDRTNFFSWPNHQVGFALGALDRMEFDSLDILGFWDATHFALFPLRQRCIVGLREP